MPLALRTLSTCLATALVAALLWTTPAAMRLPGTTAQAVDSAAISGTVTLADGSPASTARVGVYRYENPLGIVLGWRSYRSVGVGGGGTYAFTGLPAGTYRLCYTFDLWAPQECLGDWSVDHATDIALANGINTVRNVVLAPTGSLKVSTTLADGTPTGGRTKLYRVSTGRAPVLQVDAPHSAAAPYHFENLPIGDYRVCFEAAGALDECLGGSTATWATSISVAADQDVTRAFQFRPTGSVSGTVRINGALAANSPLGLQEKTPAGGYEYVLWATTSTAGAFTIPAARAGTHRLCVVAINPVRCGNPFEVSTGTNVTTDVAVTSTVAPPGGSPAKPATITVLTKPSITGTAKVGKTLKVKVGRYSAARATIRVQWLAGGKAIAKATKPRFKLKAKQRRKKVSVRVTISAPGHQTRVLVTRAVKIR